MKIEPFYHQPTSTLTYVVWDPTTQDAIIIDPVLDYDSASSTYRLDSVDQVLTFIEENSLKVHFIMETHAHADHLSGAQEFKKRLPQARLVIGEKIPLVQEAFKTIFHLDEDFPTDGSQFDQLLSDGETVEAGSLPIQVLSTPGHTPACLSFRIRDAVFTGDALFMPDFGVARCDFPGGDPKQLFQSVHTKLYSLPEETRVFTGHDYQPGGRELRYETTIGESKRKNIHLNDNTTEEQFVQFRKERDRTLSAPKLLLPSIQVNMAAGHFPPAESNGISYLKIPIKEGKK